MSQEDDLRAAIRHRMELLDEKHKIRSVNLIANIYIGDFNDVSDARVREIVREEAARAGVNAQ